MTILSLDRSGRAPVLLLVAGLVLGAFEISQNYAEVDESGNHIVDDYTRNVLTALPPNAIIFSTQWDFWVSGAFYMQLVEKLRPDVLVIDKAMLRDRPWYYSHLEQRAPALMASVKPEETAFLKYLQAFDRGESFDQNGIAPAYAAFTTALVDHAGDRPVFITQEMVDQPDDLFAPGHRIVPAGIAYRLMRSDTLLDVPAPQLVWRDEHYRRRNYYNDNARILQALPLMSYAQQLGRIGQIGRAKAFVDQAAKLTPDLQADLDALSERDLSIATAANKTFADIATMREQLSRIIHLPTPPPGTGLPGAPHKP